MDENETIRIKGRLIISKPDGVGLCNVYFVPEKKTGKGIMLSAIDTGTKKRVLKQVVA